MCDSPTDIVVEAVYEKMRLAWEKRDQKQKENEALGIDIVKLESEVRKLKEDNSNLKDNLEEMNSLCQNQVEQLKNMEIALNRVTNELDQAKEKYASTREDIDAFLADDF